jgi:excisionase family DNA binding protein
MNLLAEAQLLTVGEVALRLRQSERTVRDKIASGALPAVRIGTGQRAPIRDFLEGAREPTPPQVSGRTTEITAVKEKTCSHCGQQRKPAEFPPNKRTRDGLGSWCRACVNEARRVVPRYVYADGVWQLNPDPRPKSTVR